MNSTVWTLEQSRDLYRIPVWSEGYFDLNQQGNLVAYPFGLSSDAAVELLDVVKKARASGVNLPLLVRFPDILRDRINALQSAFQKAMTKHHYKASYSAIYPVKVNQQRSVIESLIEGEGNNKGLEVGSKAELLIALGLSKPAGTIICNGYKDKAYIRLAMIGQCMGLNIILVLEKISELPLIIELANEFQIKPRLGLRAKLASVGAGNWQNTGGHKAKFGLQAVQIKQIINTLEQNNLTECLQLLHFHIGSQIPSMDHFRDALREAARYYAELRQLGINITTVDVGGGLAIDYEGSRSDSFCSMNYRIDKYAMHVVKAFWRICESEELPQPNIMTESGRALTAHHAILITNVIDTESNSAENQNIPASLSHELVDDLNQLGNDIGESALDETFSMANQSLKKAQDLFNIGSLDMDQRILIEQSYYNLCKQLLNISAQEEPNLALTKTLNEILADKYFCNFSLFQSLPDSWAIDQIFPIVPLHRLNEKPDKHITIEDLTCDSDGRVNYYVDSSGIDSSLPLHHLKKGEEYLLGFFLIGAYQEILGDIHNLFGDTASVNVEMIESGAYQLTEINPGDKVTDLLATIHIDTDKLIEKYKTYLSAAKLEEDQQHAYINELLKNMNGFTYLES